MYKTQTPNAIDANTIHKFRFPDLTPLETLETAPAVVGTVVVLCVVPIAVSIKNI
jgi:hypothetical protein